MLLLAPSWDQTPSWHKTAIFKYYQIKNSISYLITYIIKKWKPILNNVVYLREKYSESLSSISIGYSDDTPSTEYCTEYYL